MGRRSPLLIRARAVIGLAGAAAAFAVLVALGLWQLDRRAWKAEILARIEARATAVAGEVPAPEVWPGLEPADYEYRRVRVAGTFRHADEIHIYTLLSQPKGGAGGPGYLIITPLARDDGTTIFVNRGFVPLVNKDPATRAAGQLQGRQTITGLLRAPESPGLFIPPPDAAKNVWFARDVSAMAQARGLSSVAPFLIDADAMPVPGGLPQGGETRLAIPNNHLGYALTWFGLAGTLLVVVGTVAARRVGNRASAG